MQKRLIIFIILTSFIIIPLQAFTRNRKNNNLSISFTLGYVTAISDISSNYSYTWGEPNQYDVYETGTLKSLFYKNRFSGGVSLDFTFTRYFGLSFTTGYIRQGMDIYSDYLMNITWYDNSVSELTGEGKMPGAIDIVPLSFNIFLNVKLGLGFHIKLYGGVTLFLVDYDILAAVGWGEMFEDPLNYYPDWYAIDVEIFGTDQLWGANIGFDLERRYARNMGLVLGCQYFFGPEVEYLWTVYDEISWESVNGHGTIYSAPNIHEAGDIKANINLAFFRVYAGVKIYF